jgi:hypothetical protein
MQTLVRGNTIQIDPQLISAVIGVPVLLVPGLPLPEGVEAPSIDYLLDFFEARPQGEESPLLYQDWCLCSYAQAFGKYCSDKLLASNSSE